MRLAEVARQTKQIGSTLNSWARQGKFKTAKKEWIDNGWKWVLDDEEALDYIKNYKNKV